MRCQGLPILLLSLVACATRANVHTPPERVAIVMADVEATYVTVTECECKGSVYGTRETLGPLAEGRGANIVVVYSTATNVHTRNNVTTSISLMSGRSHLCPAAALERLQSRSSSPR